jgi:NADP-dependent aldehyde dehydrogenase
MSESSSTTATQLDDILAAAQSAERTFASAPPSQRSEGLRAVADAMRARSDELVSIADIETALGSDRLHSELRRTTFQLNYFADLIDTGRSTRDIVDPPDENWPPAPRPDLRRRVVPIGVVAMFSASNFPFAFSVAGGDTASALAAGCPVIVKGHSGHVRLSKRVAELAESALLSVGLPAGILSLVLGRETGSRLVEDDRVDAIAFTGSTTGGRALFDLAMRRARPIPFYGELGSINPVFVTARAAEQDGKRIWQQLAHSFTLGAGQFCTKPGLVFAPRSAGAPAAVAAQLDERLSWRMLDGRIASGFAARTKQMSSRHDVDTIRAGRTDGLIATPSVFRADIDDYLVDPAGLGEECFGPATLIVEYDSEHQLVQAACRLVGELTATLQALPDDPIVQQLMPELESRAGRLIWNQWPTGVSVTDAMQHGGPYPSSTSSRDTSVGARAIDRFQRPVAYQGFPQNLLPDELRT